MAPGLINGSGSSHVRFISAGDAVTIPPLERRQQHHGTTSSSTPTATQTLDPPSPQGRRQRHPSVTCFPSADTSPFNADADADPAPSLLPHSLLRQNVRASILNFYLFDTCAFA